jgi:hypothetical protein
VSSNIIEDSIVEPKEKKNQQILHHHWITELFLAFMERFTNLCCMAPRRLISKLQTADSSNMGLKRGHREREREREQRAVKEESRQMGFLGEVNSYAAQDSRPRDS